MKENENNISEGEPGRQKDSRNATVRRNLHTQISELNGEGDMMTHRTEVKVGG